MRSFTRKSSLLALSILTAAMMLLSFRAPDQSAALGYTIGTVFTSGGNSYKVTSDTTVAIVGFARGVGITAVSIPQTVTAAGATYYVTALAGGTSYYGGPASDNDYLTSVTIPDWITYIGDYCFSDCDQLQTVSIGNGVKSIDTSAFASCNALKSVSVGAGVQSIGNGAFAYCASLSSLAFPTELRTISDYAFLGCSSLKTASLNGGLTSIGSYAFDGCTAITSLTIPDSVQSVGSYAFRSAPITNLTIGRSVTSIGYSAFSQPALAKVVWRGKSTGYDFGSATPVYFTVTHYNAAGAIVAEPTVRSGSLLSTSAEINTVPIPGIVRGRQTSWIPESGFSYTGSITNSFWVKAALPLSSATADAIPNQPYTGLAITPAINLKDSFGSLTRDVDYTLSYENNVNKGTDTASVVVTGIGSFVGTYKLPFTIRKPLMSELTIEYQQEYVYAAVPITPKVTVSWQGVALRGDSYYYPDYSVSYDNNIEAGTADIVITAGTYSGATGQVTKHFTIKPAPLSSVTGAVYNPYYTGKALRPSAEIYIDDNPVDSANYTVSYTASKNLGPTTVTVTGQGSLTGSVTVPVTVVLKTPSLRGRLVAGGKCKLSWPKSYGATKYLVYRSTSLYGSKKLVKTTTSTSYTVSRPRGSFYYYYWVRAFRQVGTKKYYSDYSIWINHYGGPYYTRIW